jgi:hypothetical protein
MARRFSERDGRDKPGHDVVGLTPAVIPGEPQAREGDRVQDEALFPPPCGEGSRVGVVKSKLPPSTEKLEGCYSA